MARSAQLVVSEHRSAALAERHRQALELAHDTNVQIVSRRTKTGQFSNRGHVFTFSIQPPAPHDWLITYIYTGTDPKTVDFIAYRYRRKVKALQAVAQYIRRHEAWMLHVPWDDVDVSEGPRSREQRPSVERR